MVDRPSKIVATRNKHVTNDGIRYLSIKITNGSQQPQAIKPTKITTETSQ